MTTPVSIKIACGKYDAEITLTQDDDNVLDISLQTGDVGENDESYAVTNVAVLILRGLGISQEEVSQKFGALH